MNKFTTILFAIIALVTTTACEPKKTVSLKSDNDKVSYLIGQQIGSSIRNQGYDLNSEILTQSLTSALKGEKSLLDEKETVEVTQHLRKMQMEAQKVQAEKAQEEAVENKKNSDAFLAKNKANKGVKTTASGLQYIAEKEGTGKNPKATDKVTVHYKGTLIDGTEFDSSYKRQKPASFPLNQVIPGWTEGLQLMKEGGKFRFFIPPDLAYGASGRPGIPANSALIFDVELISIEK